MRRKTRLVILFATLAAVGAWGALGGRDRPSVAVVPAADPAERAALAPAVTLTAAPAPEEASGLPARPSLEQMGADPFNVEVPATAPARSAPPPPPARPAAPPLPYRFAGRLHIGDSVEVYLAKGDDVIAVKKGDKLDGQYRVERIGRTEMTLVHLASGTRERLEYAPPIDEDETAVAETPEPQEARGSPAKYGSLRKVERGG
jgi:hypothetical protein